MRRSLILTLLLIATSILYVACSSSPHSSDEIYYLVTANSKIPYWQAAHDGWRQAAQKMKVKTDFVGPDTYDPQAEQKAFQDAVAKKPAGILISPADAKLLQSDIDAAIGQGIPVITMDSDSPDSKRLTFIGTNNYQAGVLGGKTAVKALNGKGNVVFFSIPAQANLEERLHGYKDVFAENPGIKVVDVIDIHGDPRVAFDKATEIIGDKKRSVDAFICLEAQAGKEVADVLDRNKVSGKTIIAMDTDDATLDWIKKGMIRATIAQKPYTMAYFGLQLLDQMHHEPPTPMSKNWAQDPFSPLPSAVDTGLTLVDKSNLDSFVAAQATTKQ
jgi:ribose transport system substrate-binding protein